jgi:hypothetical protein
VIVHNCVILDGILTAIRYANKQVYRGPLKNGKPHGIGSLYIPPPAGKFTELTDLSMTVFRQWEEGTQMVVCDALAQY